MQVKSVTFNVADIMAAVRDAQDNREQVQPMGSPFGANCRLTISREGRDLSRQQAAQCSQDIADVKGVRQQMRQLEKAEQKKAEQQKKAEESGKELNKAEEITGSLGNPEKDDELKAALRDMFGYWETEDSDRRDKINAYVEREYKDLRQKMAEGSIQVSVVHYSDGGETKKSVEIRKAENRFLEETDDTEKGGQGTSGWKWKRDEEIEESIKNRRAKLLKEYVKVGMLGNFSLEEISQKIDNRLEIEREHMYVIRHQRGDFTDEELEEYNKRLAAMQIPLDEQQKKLEELAGRFTPDNLANVTWLDSDYSVTLPDMPESGSQQ